MRTVPHIQAGKQVIEVQKQRASVYHSAWDPFPKPCTLRAVASLLRLVITSLALSPGVAQWSPEFQVLSIISGVKASRHTLWFVVRSEPSGGTLQWKPCVSFRMGHGACFGKTSFILAKSLPLCQEADKVSVLRYRRPVSYLLETSFSFTSALHGAITP